MTKLINITEMKQGDVIGFYGAEFTLGEVQSKYLGTSEEVYWAIGTCENPSDEMLNNYYFYNPMTKAYTWQFQGNSNVSLTKVN